MQGPGPAWPRLQRAPPARHRRQAHRGCGSRRNARWRCRTTRLPTSRRLRSAAESPGASGRCRSGPRQYADPLPPPLPRRMTGRPLLLHLVPVRVPPGASPAACRPTPLRAACETSCRPSRSTPPPFSNPWSTCVQPASAATLWLQLWFPDNLHGLPQVGEEDARAVTANVTYSLQQLHADGLLFRNVCPEAIVMGDPACLATARSKLCANHAKAPTPHEAAIRLQSVYWPLLLAQPH